MFAGTQRVEAEHVRASADRAFATFLEVIAEAQAEGNLRAGDPAHVAVTVLATLQGLAAMANGGLIEGAPVSEVVTDAVDQLLNGLRAR